MFLSLLQQLFFLILGVYNTQEHRLVWWFLYPTAYHFIASIVVLYIPYYFIMRLDWTRNHLPLVMGSVAALWLLIYATIYDTSFYHIDTVREPMIRFLFFESMLLGALFRQNANQSRTITKKSHVVNAALLLIMFLLYFSSKLIFSRVPSLSHLQLINQVLIFGLLWCLLRWASCLDSKLESLPPFAKHCITFISVRTLEIYVVQYVLIDLIRPILGFPANWFVLTGAILAAATLLHWLCNCITHLFSRSKKIRAGGRYEHSDNRSME